MTMATSNPTTVRLKDKNREYMDRLSKLTKRSHSHIMNEALEAYLPERMAYLAELNRAVTEAKTGPNFSAEDVHAWMETWGTDSEQSLEDAKLTPVKSSK